MVLLYLWVPLHASATFILNSSPYLIELLSQRYLHANANDPTLRHPDVTRTSLTGSSGSGKTYASMLLLRQLFDVAGGGPETDAFKHLAAAFTVLRSLGSAKTTSNSESSRIVSATV